MRPQHRQSYLLCTWTTAPKIFGMFSVPFSLGNRQRECYASASINRSSRCLTFPMRSFIHTQQHAPTFHEISAYARLGHKYQIDTLLDQSLEYLETYFTDDLDAWIASEFLIPLNFRRVHAIGVVNIARLTGRDILLPIALAVCTTLDGDRLVRGFRREDGSMETLRRDDLVRCINGKQYLMQDGTAVALSTFTHATATRCHSRDLCQSTMMRLLVSYRLEPEMIANDHPFRRWSAFTEGWLEGAGYICMNCLLELEKRFYEEQWAVWKRLPKTFGVDVEDWGQKKPAILDSEEEVRITFTPHYDCKGTDTNIGLRCLIVSQPVPGRSTIVVAFHVISKM